MPEEIVNSELASTEAEIWVDIPGFDNFQVSNLGRVKKKEQFVKQHVGYSSHGDKKHGDGYYRITIKQDGKTLNAFVHRLVAEAFLDNPEKKPQVDHINRDSLDNKASNLRWATAKENSENRGGIYGK